MKSDRESNRASIPALKQSRQRLKDNTSGRWLATAAIACTLVAGCGDMAKLPFNAGVGPAPSLPPPAETLLPTVHIAPAKGWPANTTPIAAAGLRVQAFASGLKHPRSLLVLPNGDVLVAETDAPPRPDDMKGIKGWFAKKIMRRAGSHEASANRISLLRDADGDGVAETRTDFLTELNSPFGMTLAAGNLYVANTDAVVRFPYRDGDTKIATKGIKLADLPAGTINHHWTKDLIASRDGKLLYASVGSNSNIVENGLENEVSRAAILEIDRATGATRLFASGLRNPNGLCWNPQTGALWAAVNERDELGSDLVPDYITSVKDGGFYGWPWSYFGHHIDTRAQPPRPDMVARAIVPDYAIGAHTAPLGMAFYPPKATALSDRFRDGAFIGQHGSWNRKPRSGYKVIFVPFANGTPAGMPEDVLTGFLDAEGNAMGRPVGVAIDAKGALLVADDVGGMVWRVSAR